MKTFRKLLPKKLKSIKRNAALAGVLSVVLIAVGIFALTFRNTDTPDNTHSENTIINELDTAEPITATMLLTEGTVEQRAEGLWEKITKDTPVQSGQSIKTTGASSRAIIRLGDGSEIRISSNTEIKFETLLSSRVVVQQVSGYIYNRITPSTDRTYIVQTKNAQFQAEGTAFMTIFSGDEEAVEVFENNIRETSKNITVSAGDKLVAKSYINPDKDGQKEKLSVEYLKSNIFIVWNRELDLQNDVFKSSLGVLSDFDGPKISITNPQANSTIETASSLDQGEVVISGTIDKGAKLTVQSKSLAGSSPVEVPVDGSGSFTTSALTAPLGGSVFEFIGTDAAGNKSTVSVTYSFVKKSATQSQSISLSMDDSKSETGTLKFGWVLEGITTPDGVKLVYGTTQKPTVDGSEQITIQKGNSTTIKTESLSPGINYFRICRYNSSTKSCDVYSNQVSYDFEN